MNTFIKHKCYLPLFSKFFIIALWFYQTFICLIKLANVHISPHIFVKTNIKFHTWFIYQTLFPYIASTWTIVFLLCLPNWFAKYARTQHIFLIEVKPFFSASHTNKPHVFPVAGANHTICSMNKPCTASHVAAAMVLKTLVIY